MPDSAANSEPTLWMITGTSSPISSEGEKAGGSYRGGIIGDQEQAETTQETGKVSIAIGKLQENLSQFLSVVGDLFIEAEQQAQITEPEVTKEANPGIKLDQIEFSVAVNGEGEVGFWGLAKGKVGGATEIKLTFKRKEA